MCQGTVACTSNRCHFWYGAAGCTACSGVVLLGSHARSVNAPWRIWVFKMFQIFDQVSSGCIFLWVLSTVVNNVATLSCFTPNSEFLICLQCILLIAGISGVVYYQGSTRGSISDHWRKWLVSPWGWDLKDDSIADVCCHRIVTEVHFATR